MTSRVVVVTVRIHTWGQPVDESLAHGRWTSPVALVQRWGQPGDVVGTTTRCPGDNWGQYPLFLFDPSSPQLYPQGLVDGDTRSHLPRRALSTSSTGAMTTTNYLLNVSWNSESGPDRLWTKPSRKFSRLIVDGCMGDVGQPDSPSGLPSVVAARYRHADRVAFTSTREVIGQEARP